MRVLVACEYSGAVRDAFLSRGHDALSCDLLPTDSPGPHYQGSVWDVIDDGWDLMIAHPPCTYLCRAGERWLYEDDDENPKGLKGAPRWAAMHKAAAFFQALQVKDIPLMAIENPRPHQHAASYIGTPTQIIQPWEHGHGETKATGLWLKGLMPLLPSNPVPGRENRIHAMAPSDDRAKLRSATYAGIAEAMAQQWGTADTLVSLF